MKMLKNHYEKELHLSRSLKKGDRGTEVKKAQEWLNLWRYIRPEWVHIITVDGQFGPQTYNSVREFQKLVGTPVTGRVNKTTFAILTEPMKDAFAIKSSRSLRNLITDYALQHLEQTPRELNNSNEGPWVRAYMDGNHGQPWAWCVGFVQTIIDQACTTMGKKFTSLMPHTYSCDVLGVYGQTNGQLIRNRKLKQGDFSELQTGDLFLMVKNPRDWVHAGVILKREGDWLHTVEGNTNDEGVREGFEVCRRMRNFRTHNIDILSLGIGS